jgi:hypothetical protein
MTHWLLLPPACNLPEPVEIDVWSPPDMDFASDSHFVQDQA